MKKADNFNPAKWLVENKITNQSQLNENQSKKKDQLDLPKASIVTLFGKKSDEISIADVCMLSRVSIFRSYEFMNSKP